MPTILRLRLILHADVTLRLESCPAHGWFFKFIRECDEAWANALHGSGSLALKEDVSSQVAPLASSAEGLLHHLSLVRDQNLEYEPGFQLPATNPALSSTPLPNTQANFLSTPFTTSFLYCPGQTLEQDEYHLRERVFRGDDPHDPKQKIFLRAGQQVAFRLALADDDRARWLCQELARTNLPPLGTAPCQLIRVPALEPHDPDTRQCSWSDLADTSPVMRLFISFQTPTAYSHAGHLFPSLELDRLRKSWQRSWQHAPKAGNIENMLDEAASNLTTVGLGIIRQPETAEIFLKGDKRKGYVGMLELAWEPGTSVETRRAFAALAGLANFLGTGAKTALGMGQTRIRW